MRWWGARPGIGWAGIGWAGIGMGDGGRIHGWEVGPGGGSAPGRTGAAAGITWGELRSWDAERFVWGVNLLAREAEAGAAACAGQRTGFPGGHWTGAAATAAQGAWMDAWCAGVDHWEHAAAVAAALARASAQLQDLTERARILDRQAEGLGLVIPPDYRGDGGGLRAASPGRGGVDLAPGSGVLTARGFDLGGLAKAVGLVLALAEDWDAALTAALAALRGNDSAADDPAADGPPGLSADPVERFGPELARAAALNPDVASALASAPGNLEELDPAEVAAWWGGLTQPERNAVMLAAPESIGNWDGIPTATRSAVNEYLIGVEQVRVDRELARLEAAGQGGGERAEDLRLGLDAMAAVERALERPDTYLVQFDASGNVPLAAVAVGNPDAADSIGVTVPGMNTTVSGSLENMVDEAAHLREETIRQLGREGLSGDPGVSTIAWIGYEAPSADPGVSEIGGLVDVALPQLAAAGATDLNAYLRSLESTSRLDAAATRITLLGHSYGSLTASLALGVGGHPVDSLVVYGSPGVGSGYTNGDFDVEPVRSAGDLGLREGMLFAMDAPTDAVPWLGRYGTNPHLEGSGFTSLRTGETSIGDEVYEGSSGHGGYPRPADPGQVVGSSDVKITTYNMAAVVAGLVAQARVE